ncbi:ABC transporter ATP-binding protein [Roseateles cellulosilyticus]|uniref:ABC transporter ATP-binding protein/permease n=1 Tax=Pelomonas cellulosilytica TaxID=2906762 RepID=A0ABS8Y4B8_9BURK|nr:ABC transporter ATP-binding protein [Pelomonas sp. P8]MCE4558043.1 ABC transporter ATP-binding protein/permease [Pelomonas sp. P8]
MMIRLWRAIEPRRRQQFVGLLALMFVGSLTEVVSIGAVLPFLGALASPERVFEQPALKPMLLGLGVTSAQQVILPLTIAFCAASLLAGGMRVLVLRLSLGYAFGLGLDLSTEVYRRTLHQPYAVHVARNSSKVINGIAIKTSEVIFYVIVPAMTLVSAALMSLAIIATLANIVPLTALASFAVFGVLYAAMVKLLRRRLKDNSEIISRESTHAIQHLQEGLGGIRDILLDGTQESFVTKFRRTDVALRTAQRDNSFVSLSPRHMMESAGMVLIALIAYGFTQSGAGVAAVIPMLAALALGLQRLLPALQQLYHSLSTIHGAEDSLREMLHLLDQRLPAEKAATTERALGFEREIRMRGLGFRYSEQAPWILDDQDLVISKGARVGFVGETGSGKSTLLDIIMGLLHPTRGELLVDDIPVTEANVAAWRPRIAHVPQDIFLTDGTVWENIAFGVPRDRIDEAAVRNAASLAQIGPTIESWSQGFDTIVGERGVQLSGGQRQRIGIARALYKQADVFVFDEATSALDSATEEAVMRAIEQMDKRITILIIAHRLTTLKNCDRIVELKRPSEEITLPAAG